MKTLHICLFGGPGIGKSTTAAELFYKMKKLGYSVELTSEYAKDLVYREQFDELQNQLWVLANQHRKWDTLEGKVEYVIHDSPILLGIMYSKETETIPKKALDSFIIELHSKFKTLNILLKRKHTYVTEGRMETEIESMQKDIDIRNLLIRTGTTFHVMGPEDILNMIENIKG